MSTSNPYVRPDGNARARLRQEFLDQLGIKSLVRPNQPAESWFSTRTGDWPKYKGRKPAKYRNLTDEERAENKAKSEAKTLEKVRGIPNATLHSLFEQQAKNWKSKGYRPISEEEWKGCMGKTKTGAVWNTGISCLAKYQKYPLALAAIVLSFAWRTLLAKAIAAKWTLPVFLAELDAFEAKVYDALGNNTDKWVELWQILHEHRQEVIQVAAKSLSPALETKTGPKPGPTGGFPGPAEDVSMGTGKTYSVQDLDNLVKLYMTNKDRAVREEAAGQLIQSGAYETQVDPDTGKLVLQLDENTGYPVRKSFR